MPVVPGDARALAPESLVPKALSSGAPDRSFPRACRLVSSADFRRAYRSRWRGRLGPFAWHVQSNGLEHPRLGLSVPKRVVKRAAARSRLKRLVRESFRQNRNRLPSVDIVISVKAQPGDLHDPALRQVVDSIWQDILSTAQNAPCT